MHLNFIFHIRKAVFFYFCENSYLEKNRKRSCKCTKQS
nr:MAG TPA: hypothetical protein [Caudoviricetes sp.]